MQAIFKKYDLRGIVGQEFNICDTYDLTKAIVTYFKKKYPTIKTIAVGMDGRISSPEIKALVCQAMLDSGLDVQFIGLCTTPALYFACHTLNVHAGIMITASHNPKEYNGFKIVLQKESIWGNQIEEIKKIYNHKNFIKSKSIGFYDEPDLITSYINYLASDFSHLANANLKIVIDCGNGSAGVVIPKLIKKLNWHNAVILYPDVDGHYPNHEPNPVELKNMLSIKDFLLKQPDYKLGIGLDGDCDRVAAMTTTGDLIAGDVLLGVFALNLAKQDQITVVMDSKCSNTVTQTLNDQNIKTYIAPTGFAYIKQYLKTYNGTIGGELSGHFCFKDRYFGFDDGIYAMLRLCEILIKTDQSLEQLIDVFPKSYCSPEFRITCPDNQKNLIISQIHAKCLLWPQTTISTLDGIRAQTPQGWFLVRPANTEPVLSVRIEGNSIQDLKKLQLELFEIIAQFISCHELILGINLENLKMSDRN